MNIEKYVGKRIKEARKRSFKTQSDLADALGINSVTVSRWETGARFPGLKMLDTLASWFDVPIAYFFENKNYSAKCFDCKTDYEYMGCDIVLPNDQWDLITNHKKHIILCGSCIALRARKIPGVIYINARLFSKTT